MVYGASIYSSYLQPGLFDFEAYFSYSSALFSNLVRALIAVMFICDSQGINTPVALTLPDNFSNYDVV